LTPVQKKIAWVLALVIALAIMGRMRKPSRLVTDSGPGQVRRLGRLASALALPIALASAPAVAAPPTARDFEVFASDLAGPEGLAFTKDGRLIVGSTTGDLLSFRSDGTSTLLANLAAPLAGITVLADGRVLAASVATGRVFAVTPRGESSVLAEGIGGANFVVQTLRDGRILVSASNSGEILDITDGTPRVLASGLNFPNGLATDEALGGRHLYVALTLPGQVVRLELRPNGSLGEPELFAEGLTLADGLAFDSAGKLLVVGFGMLWVVDRTGNVQVLSDDPLLDFPANLAFGQGWGFNRRDVYLANFGDMFGNGTDVVRFRYSTTGAPLASGAGSRFARCTPPGILPRAPLAGGQVRCFPAITRRVLGD
jgi:sugar lactone lactonase YvrE